MKKIYLLIIFSFFLGEAFSQNDNSDVKTDDNFGPNKTYFVHSYMNLGFVTPPNSGNDVDFIYGKSHSFSYGIKYKYKIINIFSIGLGVNYNYQSWHLKQNSTKLIPNNVLYDKEKISINNIGAEFFLRFNYGVRKNTLGNYFDIAPYFEYAFNTKRKITIKSEEQDNILGEKYLTQTNVNLNYIQKINYGMQIKLGFERVALFAKYRFSDIFTNDFKKNVSTTELARLIVGIDISLHE